MQYPEVRQQQIQLEFLAMLNVYKNVFYTIILLGNTREAHLGAADLAPDNWAPDIWAPFRVIEEKTMKQAIPGTQAASKRT